MEDQVNIASECYIRQIPFQYLTQLTDASVDPTRTVDASLTLIQLNRAS